jgi:hypothetical protein
MLLGPARKAERELAAELGREIEIRARPGLHQEQFEVVALDEGPPVSIRLRWLESGEEAGEPKAPASAIAPAVDPQAAGEAPAAPEAPEPAPAEPVAGIPAGPGAAAGVEPAEAAAEELAEPVPAPGAEMVDEEEEKPILPRFQERGES